MTISILLSLTTSQVNPFELLLFTLKVQLDPLDLMHSFSYSSYHHCPRSESGDLALLASVLLCGGSGGVGQLLLVPPCLEMLLKSCWDWECMGYSSIYWYIMLAYWILCLRFTYYISYASCGPLLYAETFIREKINKNKNKNKNKKLDIQGWCKVDQFKQLWFIAWFSHAAS